MTHALKSLASDASTLLDVARLFFSRRRMTATFLDGCDPPTRRTFRTPEERPEMPAWLAGGSAIPGVEIEYRTSDD